MMARPKKPSQNDPLNRYWPTTLAYEALGLDVPAGTPAPVVEHHFEREGRQRSYRQVLGPALVVPQHRCVCSCGWASRWSKWEAPTFRQMQTHAIEGQRSFDWPA